MTIQLPQHSTAQHGNFSALPGLRAAFKGYPERIFCPGKEAFDFA